MMPCRNCVEPVEKRSRVKIYSRVRLRYNVAAFRRDHDSMAYSRATWIVDSFKEASRNTGRPLYAWFIVELTITIRWTILNPMASHTQGKSDKPSVVRLKFRTYLSAHNGSTHN